MQKKMGGLVGKFINSKLGFKDKCPQRNFKSLVIKMGKKELYSA